MKHRKLARERYWVSTKMVYLLTEIIYESPTGGKSSIIKGTNIEKNAIARKPAMMDL